MCSIPLVQNVQPVYMTWCRGRHIGAGPGRNGGNVGGKRWAYTARESDLLRFNKTIVLLHFLNCMEGQQENDGMGGA